MKRTHLKHRTPLKLVVFAFLVISLIIAFSVSFKLYLDAAFVDLRKFDWNGVAGISNALIVVINLFLSVGIFLSYTSIQESTKARTLETLQIAAEYIDAIQVDMELLRNHHAGDIGNLEDKISIQRAASKIPVGPAQNISKTMQRLSYFVKKKIIPEDIFIEMWGPLFIEMWLHLEPWIIQKRIENGEAVSVFEGAYSRKDFEWFARRCAIDQSTGLTKVSENLGKKFPSGMDRLQSHPR